MPLSPIEKSAMIFAGQEFTSFAAFGIDEVYRPMMAAGFFVAFSASEAFNKIKR